MTAEAERLIAQLRPHARRASSHAYAPYSGLRVGAAVLAAEGGVHLGCNVESDSYGLTQCAERSAIGAAIAAGVRPRTLTRLVVYLPGERALPPCGACRQVMRELMARDALVVACCDGQDHRAWSLDELLPDAFTLGDANPGDSPE